MKYKPEEIPDSDKVFRRILYFFVKKGKVRFTAFRFDADGMSVNWERYCTAKKTCIYNNKEHFAVSFSVKDIRKEDVLDVIHNPSKNNRSHSLVTLDLKEKEDKDQYAQKMNNLWTQEYPNEQQLIKP